MPSIDTQILPLPTERSNPTFAGLLGLCFGPLGTAISLRTWQHTTLVGVTYVAAGQLLGGPGLLGGLVLCAAYNAVQTRRANARLDGLEPDLMPVEPITELTPVEPHEPAQPAQSEIPSSDAPRSPAKRGRPSRAGNAESGFAA